MPLDSGQNQLNVNGYFSAVMYFVYFMCSNESVSVTETDSSDSSNDDTPPPDSVHHKPGDREHTKVTFNTEPEETNPPHGHSTVRDQEQLGMNVSKVDSPWDRYAIEYKINFKYVNFSI